VFAQSPTGYIPYTGGTGPNTLCAPPATPGVIV
jgi:hypothetical protein